ncbi:preprotein translocase subunit YajC [Aestuariimicrobium soli]|uniref:preprotein translocase subunit YajC n=1 Tax=Aestuariimicrobium soli TaxID=2035834 RepID=UPI003EBBED1A
MQPLLVSQGLSTIIMLVGLVAVFYLLLIRPMRKQAAEHAKKQQALRDSLAAGVRVQLAGGLFGSVKHVGEKQAIVELAPGVEVTVMKDAILKTVEASEEEFEYEDDASAEDATTEDPTTEDPTTEDLEPTDLERIDADPTDADPDLDSLDPPAQPGEQRV